MNDGYEIEYNDQSEIFTDREMQLAKRFIQLIGNMDRVDKLLDKIDSDCGCDTTEEDTISQIAQVVPTDVDMPNMAPRYNPGAISGPDMSSFA